MPGVISFRPTPEEEALIERAQKTLGTTTRSEALRRLLVAGASATAPVAKDPLLDAVAPREFWLDRSLTSREIDEALDRMKRR